MRGKEGFWKGGGFWFGEALDFVLSGILTGGNILGVMLKSCRFSEFVMRFCKRFSCLYITCLNTTLKRDIDIELKYLNI